MSTFKRDIKHILDLQDAIDYMEAKLAVAEGLAGQIIERNKILAEIQLMKKEEDLKCKIQKIGYGDSTSSSKTSPQGEKK